MTDGADRAALEIGEKCLSLAYGNVQFDREQAADIIRRETGIEEAMELLRELMADKTAVDNCPCSWLGRTRAFLARYGKESK